MMRTWFLPSALAFLLAFAPLGAHADSDDEVRERLRSAVERGEIRSLSDLQREIRRTFPGEIIGVDLDEDDGRFVYEFKVLQSSGRVLEIEIDAATGKVLDVEND